MRGVVYGGLAIIGVAALSAVTQQVDHDVPWAGSGLDLDGFGDKLADLLPYALFTLLPILGVVIVMLVGAIAARPAGDAETWVKPRITAAFVFSFFGLGMIFVGMLGGALVPIADLGLQGTVFEEGVLRLRRLRRRARRPRRASPTGRRSGPGGRSPTSRRSGSPRSACWPPCSPRCRTTSPASPTSRRPPARTTTTARPSCGTSLVTVGHALMAVVVLAFVGLWLKPPAAAATPMPATTRGAARPSSG